MVLTLGNALNGGTFRGNAPGFHLDALVKVSRSTPEHEVRVDGESR